MWSGLAGHGVLLQLLDHDVAGLVGAGQLQQEDRVLARAAPERRPSGPSGPRWIGTVGFLAPYTTAGIFPSPGSRRASFLPIVERFSTFNSIVFMLLSPRVRREPARTGQRGGRKTGHSTRKATKRKSPGGSAGWPPPGGARSESDRIRGQRAMAASTGMRVGDEQGLESRGLDPLEGGPGKDGVDGRGVGLPAPWPRRASSAWTRVPAVSTMSSRIRTFRPSTSPTTFRTSVSFLPGAPLVDDRERGAEPLARSRGARATPPTSGETMTSVLEVQLAGSRRAAPAPAKRWSTGMLKKPWICAACEVHRSGSGRRRRPCSRSAISLAAIRHARLVLLVLPRVAEVTA